MGTDLIGKHLHWFTANSKEFSRRHKPAFGHPVTISAAGRCAQHVEQTALICLLPVWFAAAGGRH